MDYAVRANVRRHPDWGAFEGWRAATAKRLVLLSTTGATPLPDFDFDQGDMLLFGSESAGVRSEEHTSELQSLMRISYAVFCLKKKKIKRNTMYSLMTKPVGSTS